MALPISPPLAPMLAKAVPSLPIGDALFFEPKWDGFRALIFRDGGNVYVQSRDQRPLLRYFPELEGPAREHLPTGSIVDGEIIILREGSLDFDALQQRIHPAESRVARLSHETPAEFVVFDLLAEDGEDLRAHPFADRRRRLEHLAQALKPPMRITPATTDPAVARRWFVELEGAGLDGVIAKAATLSYQPNKRAMFKIKHQRTADCVVGGFRWHKAGPETEVGSLLLGLYDDAGLLHHVGVATSFRARDRISLTAMLRDVIASDPSCHPWVTDAPEDGVSPAGARIPGGISRWSRDKDLDWVPLRPERVCEVKYDFLQGPRFRHATTLLRWRQDRAPTGCRFDQLEAPAKFDLRTLWAD